MHIPHAPYYAPSPLRGGASYFAKASEGHVEGLLPYYVPACAGLGPLEPTPAYPGHSLRDGGGFPLSRGDSKGARSGRGGEMFDFGF